MPAARELYRRMGFRVPLPSVPALPGPDGGPPEPFGAGNTHVAFRGSFLELVTVVDGGTLGEATTVALEVPAAVRGRVAGAIAATAARLAAALARFEGLHILVFTTPDADTAAGYLTAAGVPHEEVTRLRGAGGVPLGFLELDGRSPEGRLAVAEALPDPGAAHPNGAFALVGAVLCVAGDELGATVRRYARYLDEEPRTAGPARVFDLGDQRVAVVPAAALGDVLPGEEPPALPAFVASVVAVRDLTATADLLARAGVPTHPTPAGDLLVPAKAAHGAALVFRQG
ncbi:hypothetical protein BJF78_21525 [Pseudonocardia sp. CNS-139]|nr:hypothetical protein BJF78_21525 [Pseudonocardia sp. CNS-139]